MVYDTFQSSNRTGGNVLNRKKDEKSIRFLALRALVVTVLVLLALMGFDRMNITAIGKDVSPTAVEQNIEQG